MSNSVSISLVAEALKAHRVPPPDIRAIIEELNAKVAETEKDEPTPRVKQQYVIVSTGADIGWVFQLEESASPASVIDRIDQAAHAFNATKRGRLIPVATRGEAIESVPRKWFKTSGITVKTKIPVSLIKTVNQLSEAPSV